MATEKQYYDRLNEIDKAYESIRPIGAIWSYITDECVDLENASPFEYGTSDFWNAMLMSAECSAAIRLDEMKIDNFPIQLNY